MITPFRERAMSAINLKFVGVSFSYHTLHQPIVSSLTIHFSKGWTGVVGPNGAGKSTVAKLAAGILTPTLGSVVAENELRALYCEQDTADPPAGIDDFIVKSDSLSGKLSSMLAIENDWACRWHTLSHGERKRMQIALALWSQPDILALDEPFNHVDSATKRLLLASLETYEGIGILVSHERELLDSLCHSCLFMRPGYAVLRRGNFSEGYACQRLEDSVRERNYRLALDKHRNLKKRAASLRRREDGKTGKLSKRNIAKHDHDAKGRIDAARLTGKDKIGARKVKVLEARADRLGNEASSLYFRQRKTDGILFRGERSRRDSLVKIEKQGISMGPVKKLQVPDINVSPGDRIAITGGNGTGKSTLVGIIVRQLSLLPEQVVYIPQEIDAHLWKRTQDAMRGLDGGGLGLLMTAVHRLGSEPERVIRSEMPSPGEKRKMMLALGLLKSPSVIIMDEPTNHMDMPSIQCIEKALQLFDGALIIVSHDRVFIKNTTSITWEIVSDGTKSELKLLL